MAEMFDPRSFFDLEGFPHDGLFRRDEPVWAALDALAGTLDSLFEGRWPLRGVSGEVDRPLVIVEGAVADGVEVRTDGPKNSVQAFADGQRLVGASVILPGAYLYDDRVILGPGSVVEPGALIKGPVVIGRDCEVRQAAYVRGNCLVGDGCVIGHATEIKSSIMLDGAKAGHFAYIGDSILGRGVNLGAGTKLANLKMLPGTVQIRVEGKSYDTGRRKIGAILGDGTETGCNSVTSPGTLMGPRSVVYPALGVPGGWYPGRTCITPARDSMSTYSPKPR